MKRFLGILVASMFLASAAYAADTKEKTDVKAEKTEKGKSATKKTDGKAQSESVKGGKMGDEKAGDKKAGQVGEKKASDSKAAGTTEEKKAGK